MIRIGRRLATVAISAQVRGHDRELLGQPLGHAMPDGVCLWITMKQQERRPGTADHATNRYALGAGQIERAKTWEQRVHAEIKNRYVCGFSASRANNAIGRPTVIMW